MLDLGSGYLVKESTSVPLAYGFPIGSGKNGVVEVRDETLPIDTPATWRFWYTSDLSEALSLVDRNEAPVVWVLAP